MPPITITLPEAPALRGFRQPMTREEFEARDWKEGEVAAWKVEWNNGYVEAYEEGMPLTQIHFMSVLPSAFHECERDRSRARMYKGVECWFNELGVMRIPDFSAFTPQQIHEGASGGAPIPAFVIEILSPNDTLQHLDKKVSEYFKAGVQVLWQVNPNTEMVIIYTSPTKARIMHGDDLCTAGPAFPEFKMKACEVFAPARL